MEKIEGKLIEYKTKVVGTCATHREIKLGQRIGKERKAKQAMPWAGVISVLGEIEDHGRLNAQEMVLESDTCSDLFQERHNLQVCSYRSS